MAASTGNVKRSNPTRQDTFVVRLFVDGNPWGIWDKKSGGELDSDEVKYYPGGMLDPVSLGGKRTTGNITLQRLYDRVDDHARVQDLYAAVGRKSIEIVQRPMDLDGNEYNIKGIHYNGILKRVSLPDVDSESTSAALIEIEATISGIPHKE